MVKTVILVLLVVVVSEKCVFGQSLLVAYNSCRTEYNVDMDTFNALRNGDFSIRSPFIECFGDCVVKKAGFMNDDLTFNKDTITKFLTRFIKAEDSEGVFEKCTSGLTPTLCVTAYDAYQCIYENAMSKWGTRRNKQ